MRFAADGRRIFTCLGGYETAIAPWHQPDRHRELVRLIGRGKTCIQGAGLSLSGAGFSSTADVVGMKNFNRIIDIQPLENTVHVETGITLGRLYTVLAKHGLMLPVQPGHPDITIGGCIAGNVHGKNPRRDGIFSDQIKELTLLHPRHGLLTLTAANDPEAFELTCGGFGLTGVILSAKLSLVPFSASGIDLDYLVAATPGDALHMLSGDTGSHDQVYAWLDLARNDAKMGQGFIVVGRKSKDIAGANTDNLPPYPELRTEDGWQVPVFNRHTLPLINGAYSCSQLFGGNRRLSTFEALFPFANRIQYFHAYGRRGFIEHQALVPLTAAESYLKSLMATLRRNRSSCGLAVMKPFGGRRQWLWFAGGGISVAIHLPANPASLQCLQEVDALDAEHGAIANIIKDARLPANAVRQQYDAEYERFRHALLRFDPERRFVSSLSARIGL